MSFFKDFKSDFTQAMNELMPDSNEMYDEEELAADEIKSGGKTEKSSKKPKDEKVLKNTKAFKGKKTSKNKNEIEETVSEEDQQVIIQDEEEIAPEDLSDQIDDLLDQELYGEEAVPVLSDDMEVNTMDMSVEDLLNQLSVEQTPKQQDLAGSSDVENDGDILESVDGKYSAEDGEESAYPKVDMGLDALLDSISANENQEDSLKEFENQENTAGELSSKDGIDDLSESEVQESASLNAENEVSGEKDEIKETLSEKPDEDELTENCSEEADESSTALSKESNQDESNPEQNENETSIVTEEETLSSKDEMAVEKEKNMDEEKDVIAISAVEEKKTEQKEDIKTDVSFQEADVDTTYITKGTKIKGDLETDGSVDIIGEVEGNVTCQGKVVVGGQVLGDITAGELYANNAKIEGTVKSYGSVKVGVGSMIIGGIEGESAVIAGAVNGDIDVKGPVIVDSTAVIMGNIKSRSVQINNGAVIEGFCSQTYSDIDVKSFFA